MIRTRFYTRPSGELTGTISFGKIKLNLKDISFDFNVKRKHGWIKFKLRSKEIFGNDQYHPQTIHTSNKRLKWDVEKREVVQSPKGFDKNSHRILATFLSENDNYIVTDKNYKQIMNSIFKSNAFISLIKVSLIKYRKD